MLRKPILFAAVGAFALAGAALAQQAPALEGEFMIHLDGQPEKVFRAGQSLEVPNRAIHNEGAVGSKPAKLIAVYVVEKGQPLVQPAK
jgi:quercetin dioxygenase-like cupin family protein